MWMISVGAFGLSLLAAVLLVPAAMRLAHRWGIVDVPCARKVHLRVTPLLGGLAVYAAALSFQAVSRAMSGKVVALLAACAVVVALGIADDRYDIPSRFRLAVHFLVAILLAVAGFRTELLPYGLDVAFSAVWIAGMINAMNCLDCADGIVGGMTALILGSYGVLLILSDHLHLAMMCFAFAGASAGFLAYNFPPARIFLGDGGSTTVGLLIGAVSLRAVAHSFQPAHAWLALLPALLPVGDIVLVHVRRYMGGMHNLRDLLASTGKDHLPHRLMRLGLTPRRVALSVYLLTAACCAAALVGRGWPAGANAILILCAGVILYVEHAYLLLVRADALLEMVRPVEPPSSVFPPRNTGSRETITTED